MNFFNQIFSKSKTENIFSNQIAFSLDEIKQLGEKFSTYLSNQGLKKGNRVGILCFNSPITIASIIGCLTYGVKPVLLNWRLSIAEIKKTHTHFPLHLLIYDSNFLQLVQPLQKSGLNCISDEDLGMELLLMEEVEASEYREDSIYLMTSGTTGLPKPIELKAEQLEFMCSRLEEYFKSLTTLSNFLILPPLYTIAGIGFLLFSIHKGSSITLPNFYDKDETEKTLRSLENKISHVFMVPSMIKDHENDIANSCLKHLHYGGARMNDLSVLKKISSKGILLTQGYGLTETAGLISILSNNDHVNILQNNDKQFTGKVLKDINVRVNKANELLVKGKNINFNDVGIKQKSKIIDGELWFNTEDIVSINENKITVLDRSDDMIISKGSNIYPSEIEYALIKHADIDEICVFGVDDNEFGQCVVACVTSLKKEINIEEIKKWSAEYLASYKFPKAIKVVDYLPKNGSGKFDRKVLIENWGR